MMKMTRIRTSNAKTYLPLSFPTAAVMLPIHVADNQGVYPARSHRIIIIDEKKLIWLQNNSHILNRLQLNDKVKTLRRACGKLRKEESI